jgi:hypothetical protein
VGNYLDANDVNHGFLRDPSGTITSIDDPESRGPNPWSINGKGTMLGVFSTSGTFPAFIRSRDGVSTGPLCPEAIKLKNFHYPRH